jgi:hypothetical protein
MTLPDENLKEEKISVYEKQPRLNFSSRGFLLLKGCYTATFKPSHKKSDSWYRPESKSKTSGIVQTVKSTPFNIIFSLGCKGTDSITTLLAQ